MKRNRKVSKKMSVNATIATHFGAVLAFLFVMVILNLLASASCQQISRSIGERRKELTQLESDCNREMSNWEDMKTPDKLGTALRKLSLAMKTPRAEQKVYIQTNGELRANQYSVAMARQRNSGATAQYKPGAQYKAETRQRKRR